MGNTVKLKNAFSAAGGEKITILHVVYFIDDKTVAIDEEYSFFGSYDDFSGAYTDQYGLMDDDSDLKQIGDKRFIYYDELYYYSEEPNIEEFDQGDPDQICEDFECGRRIPGNIAVLAWIDASK